MYTEATSVNKTVQTRIMIKIPDKINAVRIKTIHSSTTNRISDTTTPNKPRINTQETQIIR